MPPPAQGQPALRHTSSGVEHGAGHAERAYHPGYAFQTNLRSDTMKRPSATVGAAAAARCRRSAPCAARPLLLVASCRASGMHGGWHVSAAARRRCWSRAASLAWGVVHDEGRPCCSARLACRGLMRGGAPHTDMRPASRVEGARGRGQQQWRRDESGGARVGALWAAERPGPLWCAVGAAKWGGKRGGTGMCASSWVACHAGALACRSGGALLFWGCTNTVCAGLGGAVVPLL